MTWDWYQGQIIPLSMIFIAAQNVHMVSPHHAHQVFMQMQKQMISLIRLMAHRSTYHKILLLLIKLQDNIPALAITLFQTSSNLQEITMDHNHDDSMKDLC